MDELIDLEAASTSSTQNEKSKQNLLAQNWKTNVQQNVKFFENFKINNSSRRKTPPRFRKEKSNNNLHHPNPNYYYKLSPTRSRSRSPQRREKSHSFTTRHSKPYSRNRSPSPKQKPSSRNRSKSPSYKRRSTPYDPRKDPFKHRYQPVNSWSKISEEKNIISCKPKFDDRVKEFHSKPKNFTQPLQELPKEYFETNKTLKKRASCLENSLKKANIKIGLKDQEIGGLQTELRILKESKSVPISNVDDANVEFLKVLADYKEKIAILAKQQNESADILTQKDNEIKVLKEFMKSEIDKLNIEKMAVSDKLKDAEVTIKEYDNKIKNEVENHKITRKRLATKTEELTKIQKGIANNLRLNNKDKQIEEQANEIKKQNEVIENLQTQVKNHFDCQKNFLAKKDKTLSELKQELYDNRAEKFKYMDENSELKSQLDSLKSKKDEEIKKLTYDIRHLKYSVEKLKKSKSNPEPDNKN